MSYTAGEAAALTRLRALSNFNSNNTSRGDWLILNRGKSDHYGVLRPGPFTMEWISLRQYRVTWNTVIEVWQRYKDDAQTKTDLYARVAEVIAGFMPYPHIGTGNENTVQWATIRQADPPQEMWNASGGPAWLKWELILEWHEEVTVTLQE